MADDNMSDHDRLIAMEGDIKSILTSQKNLEIALSKFSSRVATQYTALEERVRGNEKGVAQCEIKAENMKDDIDNLQKRSNVWDGFNTVAAVISAIIGIFLGGNNS